MPRQGVQFEMLGLSDLKVSLDTIRDDVRARLADAFDDSAHAIQAKAKTRVPIDKGDLARAIGVGGRDLNRTVGLQDASVPSRGGKNSAHLNPWVYGVWVEFGLKHRKMDATPFMGPAADEEQADHDARVDAALDGAVR